MILVNMCIQAFRALTGSVLRLEFYIVLCRIPKVFSITKLKSLFLSGIFRFYELIERVIQGFRF